MKPLEIGNLKIEVPIIQGGMGVGISLAGLAAAVANQGGVGVIATVGIGNITNRSNTNFRKNNIDALREEIAKARSMTKGILGVNIMCALTNFADFVKTSIEENIDIIFSGAGLPLDLPKYLNASSKTKLVPIVSSARAAKIIFSKWKSNYNYLPDAIVVEGPKAGGHLGFKVEEIENPAFQLERLIPEVKAVVDAFVKESGKPIPIIAAGGIYTGQDIYNIMQLGADAVQMATRFVATFECDASIAFKNAYINAREEDIKIINSPVGLPGRAIENNFLKKVAKGEKSPIDCEYHCIVTCDYLKSDYCIAMALLNAQKGDLDNGFAFCGANAYKIDKIISVEELFKILLKEYKEVSQ